MEQLRSRRRRADDGQPAVRLGAGPLHQPIRLHGGHEAGHRGRRHVLRVRQLPQRPRPAEDEHAQRGEPGAAQAQRGILAVEPAQEVDRGAVEAHRHRRRIDRALAWPSALGGRRSGRACRSWWSWPPLCLGLPLLAHAAYLRCWYERCPRRCVGAGHAAIRCRWRWRRVTCATRALAADAGCRWLRATPMRRCGRSHSCRGGARRRRGGARVRSPRARLTSTRRPAACTWTPLHEAARAPGHPGGSRPRGPVLAVRGDPPPRSADDRPSELAGDATAWLTPSADRQARAARIRPRSTAMPTARRAPGRPADAREPMGQSGAGIPALSGCRKQSTVWSLTRPADWR